MDKESVTEFDDTLTAAPSETNTATIYINNDDIPWAYGVTCQICKEVFPVQSTSSIKVICPSCARKLKRLVNMMNDPKEEE